MVTDLVVRWFLSDPVAVLVGVFVGLVVLRVVLLSLDAACVRVGLFGASRWPW